MTAFMQFGGYEWSSAPIQKCWYKFIVNQHTRVACSLTNTRWVVVEFIKMFTSQRIVI